MKKICILYGRLAGGLLLSLLAGAAQAQAQAQPPALLLKLDYFNNANSVPYLQVTATEKADGKLEPLKALPVQLYLNDSVPANRIGRVVTNEAGKAFATLPPSLQAAWNAGDKLNFIAISTPTHSFGAQTKIIEITKARLILDTVAGQDGARTLLVTVQELQGDSAVNVKDVEVKIGVQRQASFLPIGDDASYTTDSTGTATATFARDSLPGDAKGNLVLGARIEDNDSYGNISVLKTLPWGRAKSLDHFGFNTRSLWAVSAKAPLALLIIAFTMILAVWGIIIYLVFQIFRIKKLGETAPS
ncbi:hypothetical protein GA0116948_104330 [Chitinophaga costaii]|uniref:Uncharacterized protein n=1 Tax=Chitinophaga costaii TaxID=1335309 RepID=A0A1C4CWA4_9BACT|nr:hypothetical protein [Chitinophaga costaii]PUZ26918.1 hypothetical protein DCM91_06665 [Chitinophaga costaii]SCC23318.1 hypothetical protein GA0116948_104330 [Chitinophaga costaii]